MKHTKISIVYLNENRKIQKKKFTKKKSIYEKATSLTATASRSPNEPPEQVSSK